MATGECLTYSRLQADSKVKFAVAYELAATWHRPTFTQKTQKELLHMHMASLQIIALIILSRYYNYYYCYYYEPVIQLTWSHSTVHPAGRPKFPVTTDTLFRNCSHTHTQMHISSQLPISQRCTISPDYQPACKQNRKTCTVHTYWTL